MKGRIAMVRIAPVLSILTKCSVITPEEMKRLVDRNMKGEFDSTALTNELYALNVPDEKRLVVHFVINKIMDMDWN